MVDAWEPTTQVLNLARKTARRVHRSCYGLIDYEDLVATGYQWLASHKSKVIKWEEDPGGRKAIEKSMYRAMQKAVALERVARTGCATNDIFYYSPVIVEEVLPLVWSVDDRVADSAPDTGTERRGKSMPSERGDRRAVMADVLRAVERLPEDLRKLLESKYNANLSSIEIGRMLGVSDDTVDRRIKAAVMSIVDILGGESPWKKRKRLSSAGAQAEARATYEGGAVA
jgi:RNA polymerase sigma factor (sigma-70 family)